MSVKRSENHASTVQLWCSCALGLATPLALTVARGRAARAGFVVRSTAGLEALAQARRIVLDKTGTVTEGRVRVVDPGASDTQWALRLAALVEPDIRSPLPCVAGPVRASTTMPPPARPPTSSSTPAAAYRAGSTVTTCGWAAPGGSRPPGPSIVVASTSSSTAA